MTRLAERNEHTMKTSIAIVLLTVCGVVAFSAGCGKNENVAPPAGNGARTPAAAAPQSQKAEAEKAAQAAETQRQAAKADDAARAAEAAKAEAIKQQAAADKLAAEKAAAEKIAADKLAQASAAAAQETNRVQGLIETVKNLTGQNKYSEALKVLGELSKLKLTSDQQALVDGLKQTAEKQAAQAIADKAAAGASKAIGDLLGGKK